MKEIFFHILTTLAYLLLMLIGKTSRRSFIDLNIREEFERKKIPIIYSFWHNRLLYLAYLYRKKKVGVMVSTHKDGDYIAAVMKSCGLFAVRGSTTRGGLRALIEIIRYAKSGFPTAFTPDGPKGPKYVLQEGVLYAALKTGFPVVPICWNAKRKIVFHSWDNFILPLPFNRFVVVYGRPFFIRSEAEIRTKKKALQQEMMRIVDLADHYPFK
ncbi:MAG: lysophospholipid acyltransferase family protein [bacterium]|nr:lysophospholipid acyltransferase family protein [bacterium]